MDKLLANPLLSAALLYLAFGLLALLLGRRSQIDAWVEERPRLAGVIKILRGVGLDPWLPIQGLCLLVFGRLPKNSWFKPKLPPGVGAMLLLSLCLPPAAGLVTGCSRAGQAEAVTVESAKALAFNSAVVALVVLDEHEAAYLDGLQQPTPEQVAAAEKRVARLKAARELLVITRAWIEGDGTQDGEQAIRDAVRLLREAVGLLKSEGIAVPPAAERALSAGGYLL